MSEEQRFAYQLVYDEQKDVIEMLAWPVEKLDLENGYAVIEKRHVKLTKVDLTPEAAQDRMTEAIKNGTEQLKAKIKAMEEGVRSNEELWRTVKQFPIEDAAKLARERFEEKEKEPSIILPATKHSN